MRKRKCLCCGKYFEPRSKRSVVCDSEECQKKHKKEVDNREQEKECSICGKKFIGKRGKKYCSSECKSIGIQRNRKTETLKCSICGKDFESFREVEHCK